jgi:hypothetical protein
MRASSHAHWVCRVVRGFERGFDEKDHGDFQHAPFCALPIKVN